MKLLKKYEYTIKEIMKYIFIENPNISKEKCFQQAKKIFREIENSNKKINKNTKKYLEHNIPLSIFEEKENKKVYIEENEGYLFDG